MINVRRKKELFIALATRFRRDKSSPVGKFKAERFKRFGRFCESLVVLSLILPVCVIYALYRLNPADVVLWVAGTILFCGVLLGVSFVFAVRCRHAFNNFTRINEARAEHAASLAADKKRYVINDLRLSTLRQMKVPTDVLKCLRKIANAANPSEPEAIICGEKNFVESLEKQLGRQRVGEYKEVILKYVSV
jgi:hypothetical protein